MGRTAGVHTEGENLDGGGVEGAVSMSESGTKVRERPQAKPRDLFFVSDAKKREYGIADHEECYWARDPQVWANIEHSDRIAELTAPVEDGGMDARVIRTDEMDTIHIGGGGGDLILMAIPKDVRRWQQEEIDEANRLYEAPMKPTDDGYEFKHETLEKDMDALDRRMRAESESNHAMGLVGGNSPTAGMSYMEAEAHMKRIGFDVDAQQDMLRSAGMHSNQSDEDFTKVMTGLSKNAKTFGFGKTGLGKTTAEKLAARQRR